MAKFPEDGQQISWLPSAILAIFGKTIQGRWEWNPVNTSAVKPSGAVPAALGTSPASGEPKVKRQDMEFEAGAQIGVFWEHDARRKKACAARQRPYGRGTA